MTYNILESDPENLDKAEEEEITQRLLETMHTYEGGPDGKCVASARKFCYEHNKSDWCKPCGLEQYSALHYDEPAYNHCGDYDCMHFEDRDY